MVEYSIINSYAAITLLVSCNPLSYGLAAIKLASFHPTASTRLGSKMWLSSSLIYKIASNLQIQFYVCGNACWCMGDGIIISLLTTCSRLW